MMRWLLILAVVTLFICWIKRKPIADRKATQPSVSKLLRCSYCEVVFPEAEAFIVESKDGVMNVYCSEAHRNLATKKQ